MKKILLVTRNSLDKGGIQNVIMNIVRSLHNDYVFDVLVFSEKEGLYDAEFQSYGGTIYKSGFLINANIIVNSLNFYTRGQRIYRVVKRVINNNGPYTAVHCHLADESGIVLYAAESCGVPIRIAHAHTAFDKEYNLVAKLYINYLKRLIGKHATHMVACSQKAGEKQFGNCSFSIIYNTAEKRFFEGCYGHQEHSDPVLIQVGMICNNKNQLFSVNVLKVLKLKYPRAILCLVGVPKDVEMEKYLEKVHKAVVENGIEDSVQYLTADSDIKAEMQKADYLLFPSLYEGFGIVPIEAQALGMKCFVSTGIPKEVDCGGAIFMDLKDGPEIWAYRITKQFEKDRGERTQYDMTRFSPEVIMDQYRLIYKGN